MAPIVILGAGLTGLSTAYHLENRGFFDYLLFEKDETIGGLCRSINQDGFTFDYTGHLIHASDAYFREFIGETIGFSALTAVTRRSFIYSHGAYTNYPYQINLHGLPDSVIEECIEGFIKRKLSKKALTFDQWVLSSFGAGLAKHFFFPFQRKIFAYPIEKVTSSWMGRFVPQTSLMQMIHGATNTAPETIGYNAHFYYPSHGGINAWITSIAARLARPIHTGFQANTIDLVNKVIRFSNGFEQKYETLINTMPLDTLLTNLEDSSTTRLQAAASKLTCNSVVNFNLGINRPQLSDKHWIYFPEKSYPFYRVGFPHNFTPYAVPAGCSSLYGELSHIKGSSISIKQKLKSALQKTKTLLAINDQEIIVKKVIHIPHAYVIYTPWREKNLPLLHQRLKDVDIYSIGRYGEWKYSSMQEAILDGKKMAEQLTILPAQRQHYTASQSLS